MYVTRQEMRRRIKRYYRLQLRDRVCVIRKIRKLCRYVLKRRKAMGIPAMSESDICQWLAVNLAVGIDCAEVMLCLRQLEESGCVVRNGGLYRYR